jgi:hypothetical protein
MLRQASFFIKKIRFMNLEALDLDGKLQVCWNIYLAFEKVTTEPDIMWLVCLSRFKDISTLLWRIQSKFVLEDTTF